MPYCGEEDQLELICGEMICLLKRLFTLFCPFQTLHNFGRFNLLDVIGLDQTQTVLTSCRRWKIKLAVATHLGTVYVYSIY